MDLSWATERLTAFHTDPIMDEGRHSHEWKVSVFWPSTPFRDGRAIKVALGALLAGWQGKDLPAELWSSEALAAFVFRVFPANIVGASVARDDFGGCGVGEWR